MINYNIRTSDRPRCRSCGQPSAHSIPRLQSAVWVLYSESRHFPKLTYSEASCALYTHPELLLATGDETLAPEVNMLS